MSKTNKSNQHFKVKALHYDEEQTFLFRMLDGGIFRGLTRPIQKFSR